VSEALADIRHTFETSTDGIRGVATDEPGIGKINPETFSGLTSALLAHPDTQGEGPFVVGQDTRPSSESLKEGVVEGALLASAEQIYDLGVTPTPAIQKIAEKLEARATVAVTASHNPYTDNGWKGMIGIAKPNDRQIKQISDMYFDRLREARQGPNVGLIDTISAPELKEWYRDTVVQAVSTKYGEGVLDGKLFVYDGARGAARELMPQILRSLGARVITYACDEKGQINDDSGAANLGGVQAFLSKHRRMTGSKHFVGALANDGDGDRVMGVAVRTPGNVTKEDVLNGNHFLWSMAQGERGIVGTLYTNGGLRFALQEAGIEFIECGNGDRYVTEALRQHRLSRGGEFTGHLIDLDWLSSGDGLYSGAMYAADTVSRGMTFAERLDEVKLFPELMQGFVVSSVAKAKSYLDSEIYKLHRYVIEHELRESGGRTVIRASGTEPLVRVWGEASDAELLVRTVGELKTHIQSRLEAA
jgi:phosphoglucosamine mutase